MPRNEALTPLEPDQLQTIYRSECEAAVDWIESNISPERDKADQYFKGQCAVKTIPGRSKITVSVVRDTIRAILPSIARVFTQSDTIGEFTSDDEEDERICQEMTLFTNSIFQKYSGYKAFIGAVTNALKAKIGVIKVTLTQTEVPSHQITNVSNEEELYQLENDVQAGEVMVTEVSPPEEQPDGSMQQQAVATRISYRNTWSLGCMAPETFIVDVNATCIDDARLIGTREEMAVYEAADLGLDIETLLSISSGDDSTGLRNERTQRLSLDISSYNDPSLDPMNRRILITETWNRIDVDGDGIAELRHMMSAGNNYQIMINEPANCVPLALFLIDIEPNKFFPISVAEDAEQDQDSQTSILRSIIDNVAYVNSPRTAINENQVNLEDAKSTELGSIIRTKASGQIEELATPFVAGQTLPVLDYLKQTSEQRSGVTKLSQGLDPNALQSVSRVASNAAVMGGDARVEMMARNIGETGMVSLFRAILRVAMYQLKGPTSIKVPGGYKQIQPSMWHDQINININAGLGNGRIEEKQIVLKDVMATQQQILQTFGLQNPMVTWDNFRNSIKQYIRLSGIKNVQDFFPQVTPEQMQQFQQQQQEQQAQAAQAQQPPGPDVVGAAKVKAEADLQMTQQKLTLEQQKMIAQIQAKMQGEMQQLQMKLQQEMYLELARMDQQRDAANQQYATQAIKVGMDANTAMMVAKENAQNQIGPPGANGSRPKPKRPLQ